MGTEPTTLELAELLPKLKTAFGLVMSGSRNADDLQDFIEGRLNNREYRRMANAANGRLSPHWRTPPKAQLKLARQLNRRFNWGFAESDFPACPVNPALDEDEMLVLAIYFPEADGVSSAQRTVEKHLEALQIYQPQLTVEAQDVNTDAEWLQLQWERQPGIRWVKYKFAANRGGNLGLRRTVQELWEGGSVQLAGPEVLSALLLMPGYMGKIGTNEVPWPMLGCYKRRDPYYHNAVWNMTIAAQTAADGSVLYLLVESANVAYNYQWASPWFSEL